MTDSFKSRARSLSSPAARHFALTPSDTDDLAQRPRVIYCAQSGTATMTDEAGTTLSYSLISGQILPLSPRRLLATGTTATLYGWL